MIVTLDIAGAALACRVPQTTLDVLQWRVRIASLPLEAKLRCANDWLRSHVVNTDENGPADTQWLGLLQHLAGIDTTDTPAIAHLLLAGDLLCEQAGYPAELLAGIVTFRDRQNGIDPNWKPQPVCDCYQCVSRGRVPNDPDMVCVYDVPDMSVEAAIALSGIEDVNEPYWLTQVRGAMQRADSRRWAHEREQRELDREENREREERWDETLRKHGLRS